MSDDDLGGLVNFAHESGQLKRLQRAGWLLAGVSDPESVAEHSFRVGVLAYCIAVLEGADPNRAAALGLFHDLPESRIGDVPSVGKKYVATKPAVEVATDQVAGLPPALARHVVELIAEHESAKTPDATLEARCSRDADKLECLLQAREYQQSGNVNLEPWVTSMAEAVSTPTGKALAAAAMNTSPAAWWDAFARNYASGR